MRGRVHIVVRGRVQGVSFRGYTLRRAAELHVTGWVRNRPDGSVDIVAEGERESLEALIGFAGKGPSLARVDSVECEWSDDRGEFVGFRVRAGGL
jgi:acylphosphatase